MKRTKLMWAVIAIIVATCCFLVGLTLGTKFGNPLSDDYAAGFNAAKSILSGMIPPTPSKITTINGTVKAVNDGKIMISVTQVTANPFDDQGPTERTVNVSDKTVIVSLVPLTAAEMAEANKTFQADLKAGKSPSAPSPFKEQAAKLSDLKVSMTITVTAADDIRSATTINAGKISFQGSVK